MAHRRLSLEDQSVRGTTASIESKKTPPQLLEGLRRRKAELERQLRGRSKVTSGEGLISVRFPRSLLGVFRREFLALASICIPEPDT